MDSFQRKYNWLQCFTGKGRKARSDALRQLRLEDGLYLNVHRGLGRCG
jgi:hypothetical protein